MKRIIIVYALLFFTACIFAQAPDKLSYQAVVRNANGELIKNGDVGIRVQILQGSEFGAAVYVETHSTTTNENGLATIEIGGGTIVTGTFATVDWENGPYYIKIETDPTGGNNYTITGTSQLLSVPFALYAKKGGTPGPQGLQGIQGPQGDKGDKGDPGVNYSGINWATMSFPQADLTTPSNLVSVSITTPVDGYVLVTFSGQTYLDTGSLLVVAASNTSQHWDKNDGNAGLVGDALFHPFTHSRVYPVSAGTNTFYGVAQILTGNKIGEIYGILTVEFYQNRY
jgi:hypothetical protein